MLEFNNGTYSFVVRGLNHQDLDRYIKFFNQLSEESIRCRFGYLIASLTEPEAAQRINVDTANNKSLAILDSQQEQIVALGRCQIDREIQNAEIALVVSERMRRQGLGRYLLNQLVQVSQQEGMQTVNAFVVTRNAPIIKLLKSKGFALQNSLEQDLDGLESHLQLQL